MSTCAVPLCSSTDPRSRYFNRTNLKENCYGTETERPGDFSQSFKG